MSGPDETFTDDGYDMVLRYTPVEAEHADLRREIARILTEEGVRGRLGKEASVRLRVLQPVIGSAPSMWELRLTLSRLSLLGDVLDWASEKRVEGGDKQVPARTILGELTNIRGFKVVDEGVPLFRVWKIT